MDEIRRGIIDVHAHVLPGVDDGARDLEESCQMLRLAAAQGIRAVIATPHGFNGKGIGQLRTLIGQLEKELCRDYPAFKLYLGQENLYHEGLIEQLKSGEALSIAGSPYVLIEFGPAVSYRELYRGVRQLFQSGHWPILAHMERYACLREEGCLRDLCASGCLLQMDYSGLSDGWLRPETRWRQKQVLLGRIDLLGTDMHRLDHRPPEVTKAIRWLKSRKRDDLLERMTVEAPSCIIKGQWMGRGI